MERKAGWDTHGLPVELGVEKELGITKEDIGTKLTVEEYNDACRKTVMRYTSDWNELTRQMGYWVDMDAPYVTYHTKYMESVWWLLAQLHKKGMLYKGYTIQPYSPMAGTGLSSHELNQPGTYRDVKDTTIVAQFHATAESRAALLAKVGVADDGLPVDFLAWTTTPWTLPSNTALTIGSKIEYVVIKTYNQYTYKPIQVVLANDLIDKIFSGNFFEVNSEADLSQFDTKSKKIPFYIINKFFGKELIDVRYEQLLKYALPANNSENAFRVIHGDFVTTDEGTGIVHTAPGHGLEDYAAAREYDLEILSPVKNNGTFNSDEEHDLLQYMFPHVDGDLLKSVAEISSQSRTESKSEAGRLSTGISTRTSVEIAGLLFDGFGLDEAAEVTVYPQFSDDGGLESERTYVKQLVQKYVSDGSDENLFNEDEDSDEF